MFDGSPFEHAAHFSMLNSPVNNAYVALRDHGHMARELVTIGDRVREQRGARGLDQKALAKAAGISASALSQIENNVTKQPKPENLFRIADALGIEARYLVFGHLDRVVATIQALTFNAGARVRLARKS